MNIRLSHIADPILDHGLVQGMDIVIPSLRIPRYNTDHESHQLVLVVSRSKVHAVCMMERYFKFCWKRLQSIRWRRLYDLRQQHVAPLCLEKCVSQSAPRYSSEHCRIVVFDLQLWLPCIEGAQKRLDSD